jgi:hypothetical protein
MKIQEYKTVTGEKLEDLDAAVNALIQEGFQPFGSPYIIGNLDGNVFAPICQAMVKWESPAAARTLTPTVGAQAV